MKTLKSQHVTLISFALCLSIIVGIGCFLFFRSEGVNVPVWRDGGAVSVNEYGARKILTYDDLVQSGSLRNCRAEVFESGAATTTVRYENAEKGIVVDLPYNPAWGNADYGVEGYTEAVDSDVVEFGPLQIVGEDECSWVRQYSMWIKASVQYTPARIHQLQQETNTFPVGSYPVVKNVGEVHVLEYDAGGMCASTPTIEVMGQKANYQFSWCSDRPYEEGIQFLEEIVKSVRLVQ